jgi:hypothetical protein
VDGLVQSLSGVGDFLKAQQSQGNPQAEAALSAFQALLQALMSMGGETGEPAPSGPPGGASGKMDMHGAPGAKVM